MLLHGYLFFLALVRFTVKQNIRKKSLFCTHHKSNKLPLIMISLGLDHCCVLKNHRFIKAGNSVLYFVYCWSHTGKGSYRLATPSSSIHRKSRHPVTRQKGEEGRKNYWVSSVKESHWSPYHSSDITAIIIWLEVLCLTCGVYKKKKTFSAVLLKPEFLTLFIWDEWMVILCGSSEHPILPPDVTSSRKTCMNIQQSMANKSCRRLVNV